MGLGTLVIVSILSAAELIYILYSFSPTALKRALGMKVYLDIVFGLGVSLYFASTGTISGTVIGILGGTCLTLSLTAMSYLYGYQKKMCLANGDIIWVEYPPKLSKEKIVSLYYLYRSKFSNFLKTQKTKGV